MKSSCRKIQSCKGLSKEKIREKNLKFRKFHARGIENVRIEHNLVSKFQ